MVREIKFRAWSKDFEIMVTEPAFIKLCTEKDYEVFIEKEPAWIDGMCILMQFTGLLDKNGKEIYEGDIVKCGVGKDAEKGLVVFKEQSFLIQYLPLEKNETHNVYDHLEDYRWFEILGNQFKTPELLNPGT